MPRKTSGRTLRPLISIIVPTYNRPEQLRRNLLSIVQLDAERSNFEVIVVDDGSDLSCESIVMDIAAELNWVFLRQENQGPGIARNAGARVARGQFLAFLDDDCTMPINWYDRLSGVLEKGVMLGGHTENMLKGVIFSTASQTLVEYLYCYYNSDHSQARFLTSNNMVVSAEFFHDLGGFSAKFPRAAAEDRDFCDKWLFFGGNIKYVPGVIVEHWHRMGWRQFCRQHFNYGVGARVYRDNRKNRRAIPPKIEPVRFYLNLIVFPFRKHKNMYSVLLLMCLILSQVLNVSGFFLGKDHN